MTPRRFHTARWAGALGGLLLGTFDIACAAWLGVTFEISGYDATPFVWLYLSISFGVLGWFLGFIIDARRADRAAAAMLADAHAALADREKLATLGQLAAAIAHEVRNPLAIIRSTVQNVAEGLPPNDEQSRRDCSFITEEIDRLTKVTSSLLGFVRPLNVKPEPITVGALFDRTELLGAALTRKKSLKLTRASEPAPLIVDGDPDLLCQALLGLIANATEATPAGGEITLEANAKNGGVELAVADSGPGVPSELRARIFEPFFTTRKEGHGLGLAVIKQIADAHGAKIEVGDRPGGGARFAISFAAARAT